MDTEKSSKVQVKTKMLLFIDHQCTMTYIRNPKIPFLTDTKSQEGTLVSFRSHKHSRDSLKSFKEILDSESLLSFLHFVGNVYPIRPLNRSYIQVYYHGRQHY